MSSRTVRRSILTVTAVTLAAALTGMHVPSAYSAAGPCGAGAGYPSPLPSGPRTAGLIRNGFTFLEGPAWDAASGTLLLSHMQNPAGPQGLQSSEILRFTPPATFRTLVAGSGSNGLAVTADGSSVLAATHDDRTLSAFQLSDGERTTVAAGPPGHAFNSPNDLTVADDGTIYFTDPSFQRGARADEQAGRTRVFRLRAGVVSVVDDSLRMPNGIVLSPDGRTLYVGAFGQNMIVKYAVADDGTLGARTTFARMPTPDGATIDCAGNLYWASYLDGRIYVFSPAGREIGRISAGPHTTNAAFGDADGRTLYITSSSAGGTFGLYRIRLLVPGSPH
jgi:gluconolactonase